MSLNIKNAAVHAMASQLAQRLNTSMTNAVTIALKDKLAATEEQAVLDQHLDRLLKMANAIAARLTPEQKAMNLAEELYGSDGLPK